MRALRVTGLQGSALYEDEGRRLVTSGVPVSGAFDRHAHEAGALLVGGTPAQASVEVLGRIELVALVPVTCAVTGAGSVSIDGVRAAAWTAIDVGAGSRIEVRAQGRAYVAVAGGFQPSPELGSRSTCVLGPIGPTPIGAGDLLPLGPASRSGTVGDFVRPPQWRPHVRVIAGPHLHLDTCTVRVVQTSRIGVRVTAGLLGSVGAQEPARADLPSLGVLPGTIQVLPSGDWVLLGPDAGTMGGYPVAGVVVSHDLGALAHVGLSASLRLEVVTEVEDPVPAAVEIIRVRDLGS
jgi:allophanate hydrolase subunit 2